MKRSGEMAEAFLVFFHFSTKFQCHAIRETHYFPKGKCSMNILNVGLPFKKASKDEEERTNDTIKVSQNVSLLGFLVATASINGT